MALSLTDAFERVPFLAELPAAEREQLKAYARLRVLERGQAVWKEANPTTHFIFVVRGRVKMLQRDVAGRDVALDLPGKSSSACGAALTEPSYCCSCVAHESGTEVVLIPKNHLLELAETNSTVSFRLMMEIAGGCSSSCSRVSQLASGKVERRIALTLLRFSDTAGRATPRGTRIPMDLTRRDLAELCGTSPETVSRAMRRYEKAGLLTDSSRGILILDSEGLRAAAEEGGRR